jgi:hypothetical protein
MYSYALAFPRTAPSPKITSISTSRILAFGIDVLLTKEGMTLQTHAAILTEKLFTEA